MAGPNYVLSKGFKAGAAITQYRFVSLAAAETVTQTATLGAAAIGVAQETISTADATSGRIVNVALLGVSRCIAGQVLATPGIQVASNASGQVKTVGTGENSVGILLNAATATGAHVDVLLTQAGIL